MKHLAKLLIRSFTIHFQFLHRQPSNMFYLYQSPSCFQQKLHNFIGKSIEFVAESIGILWRSERRVFKVWRFLITALLIVYNTIMTYKTSPSSSGVSSGVVYAMLDKISTGSFSVVTIVILVMIIIEKGHIRECFINSEYVHWMRHQLLKTKTFGFESLFHKFLLKIALDIVVWCMLIFFEVATLVVKPTFFSFFNGIMSPINGVVYYSIGTIYCIPLAFALTYTQTIHEDVKDGVNYDLTLFHHILVRFTKKIQKTFQVTLLFLMWKAFIGFVSQVRLCGDQAMW